jgi:hypothetical protein
VRSKDWQSNNWRDWKKGFPYKGLNDPKYIRARDELFNENGNGWWIEYGARTYTKWTALKRERERRLS